METALLAKFVRPGMAVLDVGTGREFRIAKWLVEMGAIVTAVDVEALEAVPAGVSFVQSRLEDYVPDTTFDVIILRNVLQFCDKQTVLDEVLPRLFASLNPDGMMYIMTFYDDPDPPFEKSFASFYRLEDLSGFGTPIHQFEGEVRGKDLRGRTRLFRLVEYLAKS